MNLIGHNYIAYKVLGNVFPNTLLGSHIPDFVPFLPSSVFSFEEIHENHEKFLDFVRDKYPNMEDLPLSIMCHSVKYGADEYNKEIESWTLKNNSALTKTISKMIAEASNIDYEIARGPRLHNYLWCGLDLYLIKENPEDITSKLADTLDKIDYPKTAEVLAEFYGKEVDKVEDNLRNHFSYIRPETFKDVRSYTISASKLLSSLKEGDNLDIDRGTELLEFIYETFKNMWSPIVNRVESAVKKKLLPLLT